jgi:hypothetical protein
MPNTECRKKPKIKKPKASDNRWRVRQPLQPRKAAKESASGSAGPVLRSSISGNQLVRRYCGGWTIGDNTAMRRVARPLAGGTLSPTSLIISADRRSNDWGGRREGREGKPDHSSFARHEEEKWTLASSRPNAGSDARHTFTPQPKTRWGFVFLIRCPGSRVARSSQPWVFAESRWDSRKALKN